MKRTLLTKAVGVAAVLTVAPMALCAEMATAVSDSVLVDMFPCRDNRHWMTVRTNVVPLRWEWHSNAASAQLAIVGMNRAVVQEFAAVTTNWVWQVSATEVPANEDLYTLTLTFKDNGGAVVGALTSQLAVVTGAFGQTLVDPSPIELPAWRKVKMNVVIPYDAGWAEETKSATSSQLVIDKRGGLTQSNALSDGAGYFGWKIQGGGWGYGTFDLALTFPGIRTTEWNATLMHIADGTAIVVR